MGEKVKRGNRFIVFVLAFTWAILSIPILAKADFQQPITGLSYVVGGLSPLIFSVLFAVRYENKDYRKTFLKRLIRLDLVGFQGYAIALLFVPAVAMVAVLFDSFLHPAFPHFEALSAYAKAPLGLVWFVLRTLVFGPLPEEIGWRGYLFDQFREKGIGTYGIGIGAIWAVWHLPMFFIGGTYQHALLMAGFWPILCFVLSAVSHSVIMGKLIVKNNGSILLAIVFHFMINCTGELISLNLAGELIQTGITAIIAGLIVAKYRKKE